MTQSLVKVSGNEMSTKKRLVYVGKDNPPDYCLENFVDEADLLAMLELNCCRVGKCTKNQKISAKNCKKSKGCMRANNSGRKQKKHGGFL